MGTWTAITVLGTAVAGGLAAGRVLLTPHGAAQHRGTGRIVRLVRSARPGT